VPLLKLDAVVGLKGKVESIGGVDVLTQVGTTCALCHSTVDDSFAPGIGNRLDGWPNLDLNPGAIIALSPALTTTQKAVFNSWGRGKYDPRFNIDGLNKPVVIPPAYGLDGVHRITFTGDGTEIAYWNRYVAVTQMGGQGTFSDSLLVVNGNPVSITNRTQDLVTSKLPALQAYQLSLKKPAPPAGTFDVAAATRQAGFRRTRNMRELPQRRAFHRRGGPESDTASARRFDGRTRSPELCVTFGDQDVPHDAPQGPVAACTLLP
jgi:hypothetical protein